MITKEINVRYAEDVIVLIKRNGCYRYYLSVKDIWVLDQRAWAKSFIDAGYNVPHDDYSGRFDIPVLNAETADRFFSEVSNCECSVDQLRHAFAAAEKAKASLDVYYPSLFIDFDLKVLKSCYPEPFPFCRHIPEGWEGREESFLSAVPESHIYW